MFRARAFGHNIRPSSVDRKRNKDSENLLLNNEFFTVLHTFKQFETIFCETFYLQQLNVKFSSMIWYPEVLVLNVRSMRDKV